MATMQEAKAAWQSLIDTRQPRLPLRRGILGDGNGTVDVAGREGWAWIRYEDRQSKLSQVRCFLALDDGVPVLVGKWHPEDEFEQVLNVNWGAYSASLSRADMARYATQPHGETHHGTFGSDPAYIDLNNLVNGRVKATDPQSLFVIVEAFSYSQDNEIQNYGGGVLELTDSVPAGAGHRLVLVYFDPEGETLGAIDGAVVPLAIDAGLPDSPGPEAIPLALVDLEQGETAIADFTDIWQYKLLFASIGGQAVEALQMAVVHEGDVVTLNGEIVWAI